MTAAVLQFVLKRICRIFTRILHYASTKIAEGNNIAAVLQILPVPSEPTGLELHYSEPVTGLRLYPQSWTNKSPTIPHPLFITCSIGDSDYSIK